MKTSDDNYLLKYQIQIMKALGWYIKQHRNISQIKIASQLNYEKSALSHYLIPPKTAEQIDENNYKKQGKRLIPLSLVEDICSCMGTTLENILYYYQFRKKLVNSSEMDRLEKLTFNLTHCLDGQESQQQCFQESYDSFHEENIPSKNVKYVNNLITDPNHVDFNPWFGKYYCYFSSTSADEINGKHQNSLNVNCTNEEVKSLAEHATEDNIFCGILNVYAGNERKERKCHADFTFLATPKDAKLKKYSGILTLSANTNAVYCELTSTELGEKTYIILEKQDVRGGNAQIQCGLAMVLTFSSKVFRRRPCCERMIICRKAIKEGTAAYEMLKAYLRMNDNIIRITQWGYSELINEVRNSSDPELHNILKYFPSLQSLRGNSVTIENCAFIPESVIHTLHSLTDSQRQKFEVILRKHSLAPWYCKTKGIKMDDLYKLLDFD